MPGTEQRVGRGWFPQLPTPIEDLLRRAHLLPTSAADREWAAYTSGGRREWRDLAALATSPDGSPSLQQRALQVLLTPDIKTLPFAANVNTYGDNFIGVSFNWIKNLAGRQAVFVAGEIPHYMTQIKGLVARGDNWAKSSSETYNYLIPELLGKLPPLEASRLFRHFNINDVYPSWGMDTSSGYNPLIYLYSNPTVDEVWKRKAATKMHQVIEDEQKGRTKPRVDYEDATRKYGEILGLILPCDDKALPISRAFYQEEIEFMLFVQRDPVLMSWNTGAALALLEGREVRHWFARQQVLPQPDQAKDGFTIYDPKHAKTASEIIREFPNDPKLTTYLIGQLQAYAERFPQR